MIFGTSFSPSDDKKEDDWLRNSSFPLDDWLRNCPFFHLIQVFQYPKQQMRKRSQVLK